MQPAPRPRGRPPKRRKQAAQAATVEEDDFDADADVEELCLQDLHAGMKPSPLDDDVSEDEEGFDLDKPLPMDGDAEVHESMVDMFESLEGDDPRDFDWLPAKERKKIQARKTGMIYSVYLYNMLTMLSRPTEVALHGPRYQPKVWTVPETSRAQASQGGPDAACRAHIARILSLGGSLARHVAIPFQHPFYNSFARTARAVPAPSIPFNFSSLLRSPFAISFDAPISLVGPRC